MTIIRRDANQITDEPVHRASRTRARHGISRAPAPTMIQEIGFALDSALEGDGFELSVPRQKDSVFEAPSQNYRAVLLCRRDVSRASDPSWGGRAGRAREGA